LEALRMLAEQLADIETIDRIVRMEGGFRMGPFELMDLVGVDTGLEVSKSFYELSFGEPRWRPSPITARYAAAGLHGRKSGRGYYDYSGLAEGGRYREEDPAPPSPERNEAEGVLVIAGAGVLADELRQAAAAAGFEVRAPHEPSGGVLPSLIVECDRRPAGDDEDGASEAAADRGAARLVLCAHGSLGALDPGGSAVGFHVLPPFEQARLVELTRTETSSPIAAGRAERLLAALGKHHEWVGDAPGLVLGRIVCQVINESAFALGEGVGDAQDIDTGMLLGLSHPRGPLAWADAIGLDHVLAVLDGLCDEYREERYRAAPALRRLVRAGRTGRAAGAGFFEHPS
ncbi:MAG TPA: 3-hydroxyacyl-CoA dehydrogenase family protein, partial [Solirubrobacteraceae bacterium]